MRLIADAGQVEKVRAEIARSAGSHMGVRALQQTQILEVHDLDEWSTKEEIVEAITSQSGAGQEHVKILSLRKLYSGVQTAILSVPLPVARNIMTSERLIIGMASCKVRPAE